MADRANGASVDLGVLRADIDALLPQIHDAALAQSCLDFMHAHPDELEAQHAFIYRQYIAAKQASAPPSPTTPVDLQIASVPEGWYTDTPPRRAYLLREVGTHAGVLPRGKVGLFVAQGGAGKTMALCQLAVAAATATPWLGAWHSERAERVLLVLGEEDTDEVQRRLFHAAQIAGVVPPDGSIAFAALSGVECALLAKNEAGDPVETSYLAALRERIARDAYDLVILDPLSRFAGGEAEAQNAWATRLISAFESIAKLSGATVLVAHHTNQSSRKALKDAKEAYKASANPDAVMARGVTGLTDGARWMAALTIQRIEDEEGNDTGVEIITIALAKSNYGRRDLRPIVCHRSDKHNGALVALDETGKEWVRSMIVPKKKNSTEQQRNKEAAQKNLIEVVVATVTANPGIGKAQLRDRVMAKAGCGKDPVGPAIEAAEMNQLIVVERRNSRNHRHYPPGPRRESAPPPYPPVGAPHRAPQDELSSATPATPATPQENSQKGVADSPATPATPPWDDSEGGK